MSSLATELLEEILRHLELCHLLHAQLVCKRWAEVVAKQHLTPYLLSQDWSVQRQLHYENWHESSHWTLTCKLFRKVYLGIPNLWAGQAKLGGKPPVEHRVDEQQVQIRDSSSPAGVNQLRVTASAVFRDKLYLACSEHERGLVKVFCLLKLSPLPSLLPSRADEERAPEGLLPVAPELTQCGSILATTSPCRRKVWLYNCANDVMVTELTLPGPVYSLALGPRTLVALAGWTVHHWILDCASPASTKVEAQASFLDLPPVEDTRRWLEAHSALLSRSFLVTRATQLLGTSTTGACYLQKRRVSPTSGIVAPSLLHPDSSALGADVLEISDMALSEDGILATLTMERINGAPRYVVKVQDCNSGEQLATLPQTDILSSVQVPICWLNGQLYMKEVPRSLVSSGDRIAECVDEEFMVSLSKWCSKSGQTTHFPQPTFQSSSALLCLESARVTLVTSEMGTSVLDEARFRNLIRVCHFWPEGF